MIVSVVIPVYNVEEYVEECLRSVMAQTYDEFECIIVDDCGRDESIDICERLVSNYTGNIQFKIIRHQKNSGLSVARNTGIRNAIGRYVLFLDSDDWLEADCLRVMVNAAEKNGFPNVVFAGAATEPSSARFKWMDYTKKSLPDYSDDKRWIKVSMLKRSRFSMTAWNRLVDRELLLKNNVWFADGLTHEDELWNFQLAKHVDTAAFCLQNTYHYRVRNDGIIGQENYDKLVSSTIEILSVMAGSIDPFCQGEQAKCIWNMIDDLYLDDNVEKSAKRKMKEMLLAIRKSLPLAPRAVVFIYSSAPYVYKTLLKVPKLRGFLLDQKRITI